MGLEIERKLVPRMKESKRVACRAEVNFQPHEIAIKTVRGEIKISPRRYTVTLLDVTFIFLFLLRVICVRVKGESRRSQTSSFAEIKLISYLLLRLWPLNLAATLSFSFREPSRLRVQCKWHFPPTQVHGHVAERFFFPCLVM